MAGQFVGLGLSLSNEGPLGETLALAQRADELGFDEVSLPESRQHRAVFSAAAATLATTSRTRVRIGIANPVTRHPAVLAMEAATLAEIAGPERVAFGVGAAVWTMRALGYEPAGWQPYTNVVETVRALRQWLAGEELGFTPTTFAADAVEPSRLHTARSHTHRCRRCERVDDASGGRGGRRCAARRAGQPRLCPLVV